MKPVREYKTGFDVQREILPSSVSHDFSVLYLSDLHFTKRSGPIASKIIVAIHELRPDIILFGGDYADTKQGLIHLKTLIDEIQFTERMFAIPGNHDRWFGVDKFREIFSQGNVHWLEKAGKSFMIKGNPITIDSTPKVRKVDDTSFRILCLHKPVDVVRFGYNLVVAGHLHGCQIVLWKNEKGLYPGRFFYKWNRLKMQLKDGLYLISKGLGDTIPVRYNCPKDLIFVKVVSQAAMF